MFNEIVLKVVGNATLDTLYMVIPSCLIAIVFGLPLGVFLCITKSDGLIPMPLANKIVGFFVNMFRSFPFIILIIVLLPFSKFITGTSIGVPTAIIPLAISAIPFIARLFESALDEIEEGLIEAAKSMGANNFTIIIMMIMEVMPLLISSIVTTLINLIGHSAMAGAVGAGGLGDLAMIKGYYGDEMIYVVYCVAVIVILVQIIQMSGDLIVKKLRKNR